MEDVMLRIDDVSKQYRLGQIGGTTLRDELQRWAARRRGDEDPTRKIDARDYVDGETFMALDGVSFDVRRGERVGIIGHNGAGKSTLLKLISRVTAPTSGTIGLNGRVASMLEVGTGFHPELTGRENVYMNGAILGMTRREIDSKMEDIIEFSECGQFIDTPVKRYSSGMYVKLAFSVAAHLDSEIMIMDEVLAVGDMAFQNKCLQKMGDVSKADSRTILYVSHNMNTIRQLCDRAIVLDNGRVIFDGSTEKGVSIYLGNKPETSAVNYCNGPRDARYNLDGKYRILCVTFVGKEVPVFEDGEPILLAIQYAIDEIKSEWFAIRMSVSAMDGRVVGQTTSPPVIRSSLGTSTTTVLLDLNSLAPGRYMLKLVLYSVNEFGGNENYDVVEAACSFELQQYGNNNMEWHAEWWGYLKFPELRVIETN